MPLLLATAVAAFLIAACGGAPTPPLELNYFLLVPNNAGANATVEVMGAADDPGTLARDAGGAFQLEASAVAATPQFGPDGRIYVADAKPQPNGSTPGRILVFSAAEALGTASPATVAEITSPGLMQPVALAFDNNDNLWVVDRRNSTQGAFVANRILRLGDVAGLTGSNELAPEAVIELALSPVPTSTQNTFLSSIHFDFSGNLWYTDQFDWSVGRIDNPASINGTQLDFAPSVQFASVDFVAPIQSAIRNPGSLAFDLSGRLYVGNRGQTVVARFDDPYGITDQDREVAAAATIRVGGTGLTNTNQVGFDKEGALWVASTSAGESQASDLVRLNVPAAASGQVTVEPTARFAWSSGGSNLGGPLLFFPPRTQPD